MENRKYYINMERRTISHTPAIVSDLLVLQIGTLKTNYDVVFSILILLFELLFEFYFIFFICQEQALNLFFDRNINWQSNVFPSNNSHRLFIFLQKIRYFLSLSIIYFLSFMLAHIFLSPFRISMLLQRTI